MPSKCMQPPKAGSREKELQYGTISSSLFSLLFFFSLYVSSLSPPSDRESVRVLWVARGLGRARPTNDLWCVLSWKSHFSRDSTFTLTVICSGPATCMVFHRKKRRYGFQPTRELLVWYTVSYCLTSSPASSIIAFGLVTTLTSNLWNLLSNSHSCDE